MPLQIVSWNSLKFVKHADCQAAALDRNGLGSEVSSCRTYIHQTFLRNYRRTPLPIGVRSAPPKIKLRRIGGAHLQNRRLRQPRAHNGQEWIAELMKISMQQKISSMRGSLLHSSCTCNTCTAFTCRATSRVKCRTAVLRSLELLRHQGQGPPRFWSQ